VSLSSEISAWSRAIGILDSSEVLMRDLIERDLMDVGQHLPIARIMRVTNALVAKIKVIREAAIKQAFRTLRVRLGDEPIIGTSLSGWAAVFARADLQAISAAIQMGLADNADAVEIARRVVGVAALNGCDGITSQTRFKLAHLGRASIKERRHANVTNASA
jgi:hypothetical protein